MVRPQVQHLRNVHCPQYGILQVSGHATAAILNTL